MMAFSLCEGGGGDIRPAMAWSIEAAVEGEAGGGLEIADADGGLLNEFSCGTVYHV